MNQRTKATLGESYHVFPLLFSYPAAFSGVGRRRGAGQVAVFHQALADYPVRAAFYYIGVFPGLFVYAPAHLSLWQDGSGTDE